MQKKSFVKFSLLGLVLTGASALTAAIVPSSDKPAKFADKNGEITASGDNADTCRTLDTGDAVNCKDTESAGIGAGSFTSAQANGGTSNTGGAANTTANDQV